jgi:hypothetical protein
VIARLAIGVGIGIKGFATGPLASEDVHATILEGVAAIPT